MRKLTKKLFAAFARHTNLIHKSTFTILINVYNSNFTNCEPLFHTRRYNKDNNPQTFGKTYSSTKAFNIVSINSLFCFSSLVSLTEIFNTVVKWWNAAIVKASEYFISKSSHAFISFMDDAGTVFALRKFLAWNNVPVSIADQGWYRICQMTWLK